MVFRDSIMPLVFEIMLAQYMSLSTWREYIVGGQLCRATVWGINYPVVTSGRILLFGMHACYTVVVVDLRLFQDASCHAGRMLLKWGACYTVVFLDLRLFQNSGRILPSRTHARYTIYT